MDIFVFLREESFHCLSKYEIVLCIGMEIVWIVLVIIYLNITLVSKSVHLQSPSNIKNNNQPQLLSI